jgi:hypothetical protein
MVAKPSCIVILSEAKDLCSLLAPPNSFPVPEALPQLPDGCRNGRKSAGTFPRFFSTLPTLTLFSKHANL